MENKKVIVMEYVVREYKEEKIIDQSPKDEPLKFILGASQVISGLEKALVDAKEGEERKLVILPEDAYGEYRVDFLQEAPRDQFQGIDLVEGMTLFGQSEDGRSVQVIVKSFNDENVMIDYNHPLAGKTLEFDVKILSVRDAVEEDFLAMGGGCCGGGGHSSGGGCGCGSGGGGCCGGGH